MVEEVEAVTVVAVDKDEVDICVAMDETDSGIGSRLLTHESERVFLRERLDSDSCR